MKTVDITKLKTRKVAEKTLRNYADACVAKNKGDREAKSLKAEFIGMFGDEDALYMIEGKAVATLSHGLWAGVDSEKLKTEYPEAYKACRASKPYVKLETSF